MPHTSGVYVWNVEKEDISNDTAYEQSIVAIHRARWEEVIMRWDVAQCYIQSADVAITEDT